MVDEEIADEETISEREYEEATQRGLEMRRTMPRALAVRFNPEVRRIELDLNWGYSIYFPPERAQELSDASDTQLASVEITGVGFGIYFPEIDADLSVPSIAEGRFGNDAWEEAWAGSHRDQPHKQAA